MVRTGIYIQNQITGIISVYTTLSIYLQAKVKAKLIYIYIYIYINMHSLSICGLKDTGIDTTNGSQLTIQFSLNTPHI